MGSKQSFGKGGGLEDTGTEDRQRAGWKALQTEVAQAKAQEWKH